MAIRAMTVKNGRPSSSSNKIKKLFILYWRVFYFERLSPIVTVIFPEKLSAKSRLKLFSKWATLNPFSFSFFSMKETANPISACNHNKLMAL